VGLGSDFSKIFSSNNSLENGSPTRTGTESSDTFDQISNRGSLFHPRNITLINIHIEIYTNADTKPVKPKRREERKNGTKRKNPNM
jgi:hypothetical protein